MRVLAVGFCLLLILCLWGFATELPAVHRDVYDVPAVMRASSPEYTLGDPSQLAELGYREP